MRRCPTVIQKDGNAHCQQQNCAQHRSQGDAHGGVEPEAAGEHYQQVVGAGVQNPQVVGEAEPVEEQKELPEPDDCRQSEPEQADDDDGASPHRRARGSRNVVPSLGRKSGGCHHDDPGGGGDGDPIGTADETLHVVHMGNLSVIEDLLFDTVDGSAHVERFGTGVEVGTQLAADSVEVGIGDAGALGYAITLKTVPVQAGVVDGPSDGTGHQQQQKRRHSQNCSGPADQRENCRENYMVSGTSCHENHRITAGAGEQPGVAGGSMVYTAGVMTTEQNSPIPEEKIGEFQSLIDIVARLRAPGGCPWDAEQTHESLKRNLLEECYEALEAIDHESPLELAEELGDILVQVAFHADIAQQAGTFAIADVVAAINRKLIRRHPHVFADASATDARQVERNWEQLKAMERRAAGQPEPSAMDSVPEALPALTAAQLIQDRAARFGFDWDEVGGVLDKIAEEIGEFRAAATEAERTAEFGDILFALVNLARWSGVHAEDALRQSNGRFRGRYRAMERMARERGWDFTALPLDDKEALWQEAKRAEAESAN